MVLINLGPEKKCKPDWKKGFKKTTTWREEFGNK